MTEAPAETFDEQAYLEANPDVAAAVALGKLASGQAHYDAFGRSEGRRMTPPALAETPTGLTILRGHSTGSLVMRGVNGYWLELPAEEIARGEHAGMVGNPAQDGSEQLAFLKSQGLLPEHRFLDVGCGSLRGGLHLLRYLDAGNYCGSDINRSLLVAGALEVERAGLLHKRPRLLETSAFEHDIFGVQFDFALASSVFTHLFLNHIAACLARTALVLRPGGLLFATVYLAPSAVHLREEEQRLGAVTSYLHDPFHQSLDEIAFFAHKAGLTCEEVSMFETPSSQRLLRFRRT